MNFTAQMVARLADLGRRMFADLPLSDYLAAILYTIAGLIIAKLAYVFLVFVLETIKFDSLARRFLLQDAPGSEHRETPARIIGRIAYWLTLAFFLAAAVDVLQVADITMVVEGIAGLSTRLFTFGFILLLGDLAARLGSGLAGGLLSLVNHQASSKSRAPIRVLIFVGVIATNLDVLGLSFSTPAGTAIIIAILAVVAFLLAAKLRGIGQLAATRRRLIARFRVGDRIAIPDGRTMVIREIADDYLRVASDEEEWFVPAAWVLDSPVRLELL